MLLREGRLHMTLPATTKSSLLDADDALTRAHSPRLSIDRVSVQVLSDDLAYTFDYRAFRTLTLERPLVGAFVEPSRAESQCGRAVFLLSGDGQPHRCCLAACS